MSAISDLSPCLPAFFSSWLGASADRSSPWTLFQQGWGSGTDDVILQRG